MNKRWLATSFTISVIVVLILLLYLVNYISSKGEFNNNNDSKIIENNIKLDSNSDEAILNDYVVAFNNNCSNMSSFYKNKTNFNEIDSNVKITTILNLFIKNENIENGYKKYILNDSQIENIKSLYHQIFNENLFLDKVTGTGPKIKKIKNSYHIEECECDLKNKVVLHFVKSINDEDKIKLYYKVAFYSQKSYLGNKKDVISKDSRGIYEIYKQAITANNFDYQKYLDNNLDKFSEYVFTFIKNNDSYYFYSIE